jgi:hypothetical protein
MTSKKGVICGFWWETNLFRQIRFGWVHFCYNTSWVVGYSAASNVIIILCYLVVCISLVLRLLKRCNATTVRCKSRSQGSRSRDEEEETNPNEMEDFISWQEKWTQYQQPKKNCKIGGHFHFFLFFFSTSAVMCCNYSIIGTRYATLLCERVPFRILVPHT